MADGAGHLMLERPCFSIVSFSPSSSCHCSSDMCRKKDDDGPCVRGTAGFAYVGGACHVDDSRQKLNKAGIVEDSGGFSGVIVAAHEVGHL